MAVKRLFGLHQQSLAYAATTFGAALLHTMFMAYYVKVYLTRFHVGTWWFSFAQIVFMIWNAINDPLFGYIQDNCSFSWVKSRRHSILYGSPLFAISFLLTWFPWGDYSKASYLSGIQLTFSLCFYDTMYTFVVLAQSALFTEMSNLQEDRIQLIKYSQAASLIGASAVFFTDLTSHNGEHYTHFLLCCFVISVLAFLSMVYTGRNAFTMYDPESKYFNDDKQSDQSSVQPREASEHSLGRLMLQIFSHQSFLVFVIINLCQIFQRTYLANFAMIITGHLIPVDVISSGMKSVFYGSLHVLPQVAVIIATITPFVSSVGYYKIIKFSFVLKILMGVGLYIAGREWWAIVLFFIIESIESNAIFSLFTLCVSDIIDADKEKYNRKYPISSMVYGFNGLFTKTSQCLTPVITVAMLKKYCNSYNQLKDDATDILASSSEDYKDLQTGLFIITCAVPFVIGLLQSVIWHFYPIKTVTVKTEFVNGI